MPLVLSQYRSPALLKNGHVQTILGVFRRVRGVRYERERIETADGDFLDLDWSRVGSRRLVVLSHGLEGSAGQPYILGLVKVLNAAGMDVVAWNLRGCSGEDNRLLRSYHSGSSDDLACVFDHVSKKYKRVDLVGFSLGGNITLKYLGEQKGQSKKIGRAVVFSVPCDLKGSAEKLSQRKNRLYMNLFLVKLFYKVKRKRQKLSLKDVLKIKNFREFDRRFTAPWNGFRDEEDYWKKCSSLPLLGKIKIPTLIVNARNDPFLSDSCFPADIAMKSPNLFLEIPRTGGHVGFLGFGKDASWAEKRVLEFLS